MLNSRLLLSSILENLGRLCVTMKPNFPVHVCVSWRPPLQHIPPVPQMGSQAINQKQNPCDSRISELAVLTLVY